MDGVQLCLRRGEAEVKGGLHVDDIVNGDLLKGNGGGLQPMIVQC